MTDKAISPLRRRMTDDMTMRQLGPKAQRGYIRAVKNFADFLGHSPDRATIEDIRRYQLHLASSRLGVPSINATMTALRFFFKVTLRRGDVTEDIAFIREPRRLPVVLSPDEVARLLAASAGVKYKAVLSVAYGTGLRASEVISLKVGDIDSARMVIRVDQGKGRKDRYVMQSQQLLELLRQWWRIAKPRYWLFPGQVPGSRSPRGSSTGLSIRRRNGLGSYAKRPFGGPQAVLAYLSRYTHRVAIANSRLIGFDDSGITFKWKDCRANRHEQAKVMTLAVDEFIRRFLIHALPSGFHRIRHYGLFANAGRAANIARARELLGMPEPPRQPDDTSGADDGETQPSPYPCPCCAGRMIVIETFERGCTPRHQPMQRIRTDSS